MKNYFTDRTHILISGPTGSGDKWGGKSATANWWIDQLVPNHYDYGLFFDPSRGGASTQGRTIRNSLKTMATYMRKGENQFHIAPRWEDRDAAHEGLMAFIEEHLDGSVVMAHDEAYAYDGRLEWATATAGNEVPAKSLVVTQRAWSVNENIRSNCPVKVWVGPMTDEGERFFQTAGKAWVADEVRERHTEPYMWSVVDGEDIDTYNPVPKKYA